MAARCGAGEDLLRVQRVRRAEDHGLNLAVGQGLGERGGEGDAVLPRELRVRRQRVHRADQADRRVPREAARDLPAPPTEAHHRRFQHSSPTNRLA